jgi:peptidoglycan/LPS O-acetylase OafA/YrhL
VEQRESFEPRLESMRGIAALIVAAHHGMTAFIVAPDDRPIILSTVFDWLWSRLTNPGFAVLFFFVLSGYVLGQALERDSNYVRFIVRRAFRILPAFVFSVLFAYACVTLIRIDPAPSDLTEFFKRPFWPMPTPQQLEDNLVFRSSWINGPTWSIYWEIIGSIFLPGLVMLHRRVAARYRLALFIAASCIILLVRVRWVPLLPIIEYFYAGYFLPPLIARYMPNFWPARSAMFAVGYWITLSVGPTNQASGRTILTASVGASLMIGVVISSKDFFNMLRGSVFRFVGRISYSFYLCHWPVFYLTTLAALSIRALPRGALGNWIICMGSIALALGLSVIAHRWLEKPAIALGKLATARPITRAVDVVGGTHR